MPNIFCGSSSFKAVSITRSDMHIYIRIYTYIYISILVSISQCTVKHGDAVSNLYLTERKRVQFGQKETIYSSIYQLD